MRTGFGFRLWEKKDMGNLLKCVAISLFVAAAAAWGWMSFWGPNLLSAPDCDPRRFGGCGLLDIGLGGGFAFAVENMFNLLPAIVLGGLGKVCLDKAKSLN